jgi:LysM repeat protein
MERKRDTEPPEIIEDMSEELEETMRMDGPLRRQKEPQGLDPQKKSLILAGGGALILIILLLVFFGGGDKGSSKEVSTIKSRLDRIEKRLSRIEGVEQKISSLESQIKAFQGSLAKLESSTRAVRDQTERLGQRVEEQMKKIASAPALDKQQAQPPTPQKKPLHANERLHLVQPKEPLFGIAKKYNLTVSELRQLNNLSKQDMIQPGQRLIVTK